MDEHLRRAGDVLLWLFGQVPALAVWLVVRLAKMAIGELDAWCLRAYYRVVVWRRRVRREPLWQSHDLVLGVPPPPGSAPE